MAYFDELETRSPEAREAALAEALPALIAQAKDKAPAYGEILADVDPKMITGPAALAGLPVTRKESLLERQAAGPPFGGLTTVAAGTGCRLFSSPGPIYELETGRADFWRSARALHAAGFRSGEILHNSFAYHLTPGGWILDGGARALGCAVIPAGTGNSDQQVQAIAHYRPQGFSGTPDFLKVLLDKGQELGLDCSSITKALVSGGALFPALRQEYKDRGVAVLQCYATADLGLIAYESEAMEGMIADEALGRQVAEIGPVAKTQVMLHHRCLGAFLQHNQVARVVGQRAVLGAA